jgi:hypothetical protein
MVEVGVGANRYRFFEDLWGVLFSPFQTLESLYSRRASFLWVILFMGIAIAAVNLYIFTRPDILYLKAVDLIKFDRYSNPDSTLSLVEATSKVKGRLFLGFIISPLAIGAEVFISAVLAASFGRLLGGRIDVGGTMRLLSFARLIPSLGFLVGMAFLLYRGLGLIGDLKDVEMGIGLNLFSPYSQIKTSETTYLFLRRFDLFAIWHLIIAAKGTAIANRINLLRAFIVVGLLYYLSVWGEFLWSRYGWLVLKVLFFG